MYLEQVFTQILKMSMTAGWCILAVLVLHLIFHKAPKKYLYAQPHRHTNCLWIYAWVALAGYDRHLSIPG